jgi:hypothetical protein
MISDKYSFAHFVKTVIGKDHLDIIYLAEQEATEAWRQSRQMNHQEDNEIRTNLSYQSKLLGLIDYMRHGLQSKDFTPHERQLLQKISLQ